jgi:hypothetical protein
MSQSIQNLVCCTLTQNRRPQGCATDFRGRNWQLLPSGAQNERKGLSSGNQRLSMETAEINEQVAIRCTVPGSGELRPRRLSLRYGREAIHLHERYFGLFDFSSAENRNSLQTNEVMHNFLARTRTSLSSSAFSYTEGVSNCRSKRWKTSKICSRLLSRWFSYSCN